MDSYLPPTGPMMPVAMSEPGPALSPPRYPAWLFKTRVDDGSGQVAKVLTPPKEPAADAMTSWAKKDQGDYGMLLLRFWRDIRMYRQNNAAIMDTFKQHSDEPFVSIEPTVQTNKLCNMLGSTPLRVSWPFKTEQERTAAQAAEDWATWFITEWDRMHRSQGSGPLKWEMAFSAAVYGRIVTHIHCDPDDPDFPWKAELVDPSTCFPVFGDKWGLLRMSRIYKTTLGKVIDGFDASGERKLQDKFTQHYLNQEDGDTQLDYEREGELIDVWTRWHRYVSFDGVQILKTEHEYGRVPFVYITMTGEMGMMSTPDVSNLPGSLTEADIRRGETLEFNDRQIDLARKGLAFFDSFRAAVRYEEILYGLLFTLMKLDANPPMITTSAYDDVSPVDLRPAGHTRRRPGEVTDPITLQSRANVVGPLATLLAQSRAKAGLPDNVFGVTEGSNITGFAEATLLAATKDRVAPYIEGVEFAFMESVELAAYLYHGFGHTYVEDAASGTLRVPRRARDPFATRTNQNPMPPFGAMMATGQTPMSMMSMGAGGDMMGMMPPAPTDEPEVLISQETFELVGFRPKVMLEGFDWYQMTQKMNVAQMAVQGRIWSEWTARDKLGVEDPSREAKWIDAETARKFPPLVEGVLLPRALWETGDMDGFWAYLSMLQQKTAPPAPGGAGGPGMPAGPMDQGGTPPGIQTVQGDSQPMMGPEGAPGRPRNPEPGIGGY